MHSNSRPLGQFGWISYEIAGGPYFNIIKIFVFAPYFAEAVVGDRLRGQEYWGYIEAISGLSIALLAPLIGSMADAYGPRKPGMGVFTCMAAIGMAALWIAAPGVPVLRIAPFLVMTAIAAELAFLYHSSLLPLVARETRMGLISGAGYSGGYLGTLLVFVPWLVLVGNSDAQAFGLDRQLGQDIRIVGPLAAAWFVMLALPLFAFTPDAPHSGLKPVSALSTGLQRLLKTADSARHYRNIVRYLISRMIYYDGLVAIYTFIGIYAAGTFGWGPATVGAYGLLILSVLIFAGVIGGSVDDLIGSRATILVGLAGVSFALIAGLGLTPETLFYVFPYEPSVQDIETWRIQLILSAVGFQTLPEQLFVGVGILSGIFMAPALASSRTMMARIAPVEMTAEFFGLYTLTGKATAFIAPVAIALTTRYTQDQRAGLAIVLVFLAIGFLGLLTVKEERAVAHA